MDTFTTCRTKEYPLSIVHPMESAHVLISYHDRLKGLQPKLFGAENRACVNLWQCQEDGQFRHACVRNLSELESYLETEGPKGQLHPQCRFVFVNAHNGSSTERLNITKDMMSEILSYHQVMPSFIDLMASFGRGAPYDYQYCGFRSDIRLSMRNSALAVPRIKRSGQVLELCYSLRAVEPSTSLPNWPWSIKQLAVSHTIDVETGQSTWLVFKADDTIKDRIMSATRSASLPQVNAFQDANEALASSFGIHLILCQWAAEHWRWYVNFLEQKVQDITRVKVFGAVEPPRSPRSARQALAKINPAARSATFSLSKTLSRISTWGSVRQSSQRSRGSAPDLSEHVSTPGLSENSTNQLLTKKEVIEEDEDVGFSLDDLQQIQHIEEQIQQAMLVQTTAVKVLEQLRNFYQSLQEHPEWHLNLSPASRGSLTRFCNHIENIQFDLNSQYTRSETLVTLLANRKNLVSKDEKSFPVLHTDIT